MSENNNTQLFTMNAGETAAKPEAPTTEQVAQANSDERLEVRFSLNNIEAYATIIPATGEGAQIDVKKIIEILENQFKIKSGYIKLSNVAKIVKYDRGTEMLIAQGVEPIFPVDGSIEWHINPNFSPSTNTWADNNDKTVNFKELALFQNVEEGDLVAVLLPIKEGTDGADVFGNKIMVPQAHPARLPQGENVALSPDKTEMRAAISGRIEIKNGWVVINSKYTVQGDVDLTVGNINFNGDVLIKGSVLAGFVVKSGGNVEVGGSVEGGEVHAKKDVVIKGGVQGAGTAIISAGKSIRTRFAEHATLICYDKLYAESLIQCNVECDTTIEVTKGRGAIIGGNVRASEEIACQNLGSTGGITTLIEIAPTTHLKEKMETLKSASIKCYERLKHLSSFKVLEEGEHKFRYENEMGVIARSRDEFETQLAELNKIFDQMEHAKVHVLNVTNPNSMITIDGVTEKNYDTVQHATYLKADQAIKFMYCTYANR